MSDAVGSPADPDQHKAGAIPPKLAAPVPKRSFGALLLLFFTLLSLAGLVVLGVLIWRQEAALSQLFTEFNTLEQQRRSIETRLTASETARAEAQQMLQALVDSLSAQQAQQTTQLDAVKRELAVLRLQSPDGAGATSLLSEAEALLRLARERLLGARDLATAISLYHAADELLREHTDPAVLAVRQILAAELDILQAVQVPDLAALYQELGVLRTQVNALPLSSALTDAELQVLAPAAQSEPETEGWFAALANSLGRHFILARRSETVEPLLLVEEAALIRQALALQLEKARLALLLGDTRLYQTALNEALGGISSNLGGEGKARIMAALQRLRDTAITASVPPVGSTLNALRSLSPAAATFREQP